jgi:glutamine cyclotransferase
MLVVIAIGIGIGIFFLGSINVQDKSPVNYAYEIINTYPHDQTAFTQGLEFYNGFLYESTGLYSQSTLRKVDLQSGNILQNFSLSDQYFAEGITILNNQIYQLTWRENTGFIYNIDLFSLISEFSYQTEGWGITNDGKQLIMSDGSSTLFFLDPNNFQVTHQIEVIDQEPIERLNELEYIQGKIYANIWLEDRIAIINPQSGIIEAWIDLTGLEKEENQDSNKVLNGIAYDSQEDRIFVTGKLWSKIFEIELKLIE